MRIAFLLVLLFSLVFWAGIYEVLNYLAQLYRGNPAGFWFIVGAILCAFLAAIIDSHDRRKML